MNSNHHHRKHGPAIRMAKSLFIAGILMCLATGCTFFKPETIRLEGSALVPVSVSDYPVFSDDVHFDGLRNGIEQNLVYLHRFPPDRLFWFGEDVYTVRHLIDSQLTFLRFVENGPTAEELNRFVRSEYRVYRSKGSEETGEVLFTGYYEPLLEGCSRQGDDCRYPLYALPDDLVTVDLEAFDLALPDKKRLVGRLTENNTVVPYYDRREIEANTLSGKALPIAWLKDRLDLFFLQIQGSGKVFLENGETLQIQYRASNGHPYRSIGALLIREEKIPREEMSMQRIRSYLEEHPEEVDAILNYNPSYVFFQLEENGPVGCLNVPLTPGRSVALQTVIFPPAALAFMQSSKPLIDGEGGIEEWLPFQRFVVSQDTGGAIRGPGRADLFWGSGPYAEIAAGHMQHSGSLFFLVLDPPEGDAAVE